MKVTWYLDTFVFISESIGEHSLYSEDDRIRIVRALVDTLVQVSVNRNPRLQYRQRPPIHWKLNRVGEGPTGAIIYTEFWEDF